MRALIDLSALKRNLNRVYETVSSRQIIAMVKADAYGHGLVPVTQYLASQGVGCFGVATLEEAEALRAGGIEEKILLMSGAGLAAFPERVFQARVTPLVSSLRELEALAGIHQPIEVHLDFDTGMSRGGFRVSQIQAVIDWLENTRHGLSVEGLCTHLASAESKDCVFSKHQIEQFDQVRETFEQAFIRPPMIHIAKSSAIVNGFARAGEWVRPGIALYGGCEGFEPVMSLEAPVTLIKKLKKGDSVGYDQTWVAKRETKMALVRVGYADGYPRALSNCSSVRVGGEQVPVIGRVSMDLITLDITGVAVSEGDWVQFSIQDMARDSGAISYEILTGISGRVQREHTCHMSSGSGSGSMA